jgi:hypothetical protein
MLGADIIRGVEIIVKGTATLVETPLQLLASA